jgi:hypothetical protein
LPPLGFRLQRPVGRLVKDERKPMDETVKREVKLTLWHAAKCGAVMLAAWLVLQAVRAWAGTA